MPEGTKDRRYIQILVGRLTVCHVHLIRKSCWFAVILLVGTQSICRSLHSVNGVVSHGSNLGPALFIIFVDLLNEELCCGRLFIIC